MQGDNNNWWAIIILTLGLMALVAWMTIEATGGW